MIKSLIRIAQKSSLLALSLAVTSAWAVPLTIDADTPTDFSFTANFLSLGNSTATSPQGGTVSVVELAGSEFQFTVNAAAANIVFSFFPYLLWESHNPSHLPVLPGPFVESRFYYLENLEGDYPFTGYDNAGRYLVFERAEFFFVKAPSAVPDGGATLAFVGGACCIIATLRRRFAS